MIARRSAARLGGLLLTAALVAGSHGYLPRSVAGADGTACVDGFSTVAATSRILPEDVYSISQSAAMVAGSVRLPGGRRAARLVRYGSSGWKTLLTKSLGRDAGLVALGGTKKTGLWAVGFWQTNDQMTPLVMRRGADGRWRRKTPAGSGSRSATLTDVAAHKRDAAWAVGYRLDAPGSQRPFAMRWDGKSWRRQSPRSWSGERGMLTSVSSTRPGGTWTAGSATRNRVERPYIARRANGRWKRVSLPGVQAGALAAISVPSADEGWAVGYRVVAEGTRPLALHWNGKSWSTVALPGFAGETLLYDVSIDAGTVTVAGTTMHAGSDRLRPFVARWTDPGWSIDPLKSIGRDALMTALDSSPQGHGWAVSRNLKSGVIVQPCADPAPAGTRKRAIRSDRRAQIADALGGTPSAVHQKETRPAPRADLAPAGKLELAAAGNVRIVDRARAAGLPSKGYTYGAVISDFDGDGRRDIFLGGHASAAALYLDRGSSFKKRSATWFGWGDRHGCAASDVDGSGLPDLYCSFGGARGQSTKANQLWLDPGGPSPTAAAGAGRAAEPLGRGRVVTFIDYDGDGHKDLVLGQQTNRLDGLPSVNRVYRWKSAGRFSAVRSSGIAPAVGARAFDTGDIDRDGRVDLLMVTDDPRASGRTSSVKLYRNTRTGFKSIGSRRGIKSIGERDAELVRLDGDKWPDLVQLSGDRIRVSLQRNGRFKKVYERSISKAVAVAAGDADGDGDKDLYVLRQKNRSSVRDIILFNRGDGRSFKAVAAPSRMGGTADDVFPIDHDQNGLTDFLVLNGRGNVKGPLQLISFYR